MSYIATLVFSDERTELTRFAYFFILTNIVFWITSYNFRIMGKVRFAEINQDFMEWAVYEKNTGKIFIKWDDVRWIKKEKNGSVTIYQDSSFSNNLPLSDFTKEDKKEILDLLHQSAVQRQISLVNFSEPVLVLA